MIKTIIQDIKNINKSALKIMFYGFKFSFIFYIVSSIILFTYIMNPVSHIIFECGIILFRTGITLCIFCFICAFTLDKIKH